MARATSRHLLVRSLALVTALALIAAACGSSDDDGGEQTRPPAVEDAPAQEAAPAEEAPPADETPPPAEGAPVPGGTLRIGVEAETDGLNPTTNALAVSGLLMGEMVFDTIAKWSPDNEAVPWLAESWTPNEDFTTWTFTLRDGITFSDGTPMSADAFIRTAGAQLADPLIGLAVRPVFRADDPLTKVDDLTFEIHTSTPNANLPVAFTTQLGMVASPTWLDAALENPELNQEPVGSGPFVLESRTQDDRTVFVANPDWWGGDVALDRVEVYPVTRNAIRTDQLLVGDLDLIHTTNPPDIEVLLGEDDLVTIQDDTGEESFWLLNTSRPPFDDVRARQAARFLSPQEEYLELIDIGTTRRADQFFAPESPFHNPDVVQQTDMPEMAAPLVEAYCADVPDQCSGGRIDVGWTFGGPSQANQDIADLVSRSWDEHFNVTQDEVLQDDLIRAAALGEYDAMQWRQMGQPDPGIDMTFLQCDTIGAISLNFPRQCDPARDELLFAQRAETDPDARAELWRQIVANIDEGAAYILMSHTNWTIAHTPRLQNLCGAVSPDGAPIRCTVNGRVLLSQVWLEE